MPPKKKPVKKSVKPKDISSVALKAILQAVAQRHEEILAEVRIIRDDVTKQHEEILAEVRAIGAEVSQASAIATAAAKTSADSNEKLTRVLANQQKALLDLTNLSTSLG